MNKNIQIAFLQAPITLLMLLSMFNKKTTLLKKKLHFLMKQEIEINFYLCQRRESSIFIPSKLEIQKNLLTVLWFVYGVIICKEMDLIVSDNNVKSHSTFLNRMKTKRLGLFNLESCQYVKFTDSSVRLYLISENFFVNKYKCNDTNKRVLNSQWYEF